MKKVTIVIIVVLVGLLSVWWTYQEAFHLNWEGEGIYYSRIQPKGDKLFDVYIQFTKSDEHKEIVFYTFTLLTPDEDVVPYGSIETRYKYSAYAWKKVIGPFYKNDKNWEIKRLGNGNSIVDIHFEDSISAGMDMFQQEMETQPAYSPGQIVSIEVAHDSITMMDTVFTKIDAMPEFRATDAALLNDYIAD